jgi:carboxyl-terminal processing protease
LQYDLSDGSAMRLTVSRYYTPMGRSIQRSYENGRKVYMDEIWERYSTEENIHTDSIRYVNGKVYKTDCGDTVYGGGGIMPDILVPMDTTRFQATVRRLILNGGINNFAYQYYLKNKAAIDAYTSVEQFNTQFTVNENIWGLFSNFAKNDSVNVNTLSAREKAFLQLRIKAQLARLKWRSTGYYQVLNTEDEIFRKGWEVVNQ